MKRFALTMLALCVVAGCSPSQEPESTVENTTPTTPRAEAPAPAPAPTTAATETVRATAAPEAAAAPATTTDAEPVAAAQVDLSGVTAAGFVEGQHYRRLSPTQTTTTSPDSVEVAEFFMHSCIHCYNLEPHVEAWLPNKPETIDFVRVPTTWDPIRRLHAQAFYTAVALGLEEEIHMPFFREFHDRGNYLQTADALADFFTQFGVSREDFEGTFESFFITSQVNRAEELGNRYRVDSTPTIIVNGKYRTDVGMAGGYDQLFALIEALATAELGG